MDPIYEQALNGTLATPTDPGPMMTGYFRNDLPIPVTIFWVDYVGYHIPEWNLQPGDEVREDFFANSYWIVKSQNTGGFIGAFEMVEEREYYDINHRWLLNPNAIGTFPEPTTIMVIPVNSPLVVVGCGEAADKSYFIIREQYWHRLTGSYSLAAGESQTFSYTITNGREDTSSTQETVSSSIGTEVSAGWGPVSSSISSTLSTSSTTFQQVIITEQRTLEVSQTLQNQTETSVMYLKWQMNNSITVFDTASNKSTSSLTLAEAPSLIVGPYNLMDLPEGLDRAKALAAIPADILARVPTHNAK